MWLVIVTEPDKAWSATVSGRAFSDQNHHRDLTLRKLWEEFSRPMRDTIRGSDAKEIFDAFVDELGGHTRNGRLGTIGFSPGTLKVGAWGEDLLKLPAGVAALSGTAIVGFAAYTKLCDEIRKRTKRFQAFTTFDELEASAKDGMFATPDAAADNPPGAVSADDMARSAQRSKVGRPATIDHELCERLLDVHKRLSEATESDEVASAYIESVVADASEEGRVHAVAYVKLAQAGCYRRTDKRVNRALACAKRAEEFIAAARDICESGCQHCAHLDDLLELERALLLRTSQDTAYRAAARLLKWRP